MKNRTILVPFEGLMKAMEEMLIKERYIKEGEKIIYADFNFQVDESDNIPINVGILEYLSNE